MDRDDLLSLVGAMQEDLLAVKPDGTICDLDNTPASNEWSISDVEAAVGELTDDLNKLLAWAKLAPKNKEPHQ